MPSLGLLRVPARAVFRVALWGLRRLALQTLQSSPSGSVTVITATWNTLEYLKICAKMMARYSPNVALMVIDNHSTDGTREWAIAQAGLRYIRLPRNIGHPLALDLGCTLARTEYVVTVDVDGFPITDDWLDALIKPLSRRQVIASGAAADFEAISYPYIHPSCMALRRADFLRYSLTFWPAAQDSDVGAEISRRYPDRLHRIPVTSVRGPGVVGSVIGGFFYHNWGSTRPGLYETGADAWAEALDRYVLRTEQDESSAS